VGETGVLSSKAYSIRRILQHIILLTLHELIRTAFLQPIRQFLVAPIGSDRETKTMLELEEGSRREAFILRSAKKQFENISLSSSGVK
jgi:hypothetical protein